VDAEPIKQGIDCIITGGVINNVNGNGTRRVDMIAGIGYGDDMSKATSRKSSTGRA
jgi:hypothetical protein